MSNPYQNSPKTGQGCLKALGIGCGSIVALTMFSSVIASTGSIGSTIAVALLIGVSVFFGVRQNRKNAAKSSEEFLPLSSEPNPYKPNASQHLSADGVQNHKVKENSGSTGLKFANPLCEHTFTREQLYANNHITCECGNTFLVKDLFEFERLTVLAASTKAGLANLKASMLANSSSTSAKPVATVLEDAAASSSTTQSKPKIEKPARPKVNLSLQQWLIIGASVLVVVAGSVFVSTNVNRLDQWIFQLITVSVAAATGFGAFKARSISVLLANFLAAFSASMQLATMSIIGDQISPDFEWNTMPAWWWCVSLIVVSALSTVLARFSKNFGFKGISVLSGSAALLVLSLGVLRPEIAPEFSPVYLAFAGLASAGLFALTRFIRAIKSEIPKDRDAAAYAKDLAKREDNSLRVLAQILAGLTLLTSIGLSISSLGFSSLTNFNWISFIATSITWALLARFSKVWIDQLELDQANEDVILKIARGISFVSLSLAATFAALEIQLAPIAAAVSVLLLAVLTWFAPRAKSFSPNRVSVVVALWSSLAVWVFWSRIDLVNSEDAWVTGAYAIAFAAVLSLTDLRFNVNRYDWGSLVVNGAGVTVITWSIIRNTALDFNTLGASVLAVTLVVATALQLPLRHYVNEKQNFHSAPLTKWVAFFFSAVVAGLLFLQSTSNGQLDKGLPLTFAAAFIALAIAAQALAIWSPLARSYGTYLVANHYLAQGVVLLGVLASIAATGSKFAGTNAIVIAVLAVLNYALGTFKRQQLKMQLGFAAALSAFVVWQWSLGDQSFTVALATQIAVISATTWLHTWFLRKRTDIYEYELALTPAIATLSASALGWMVLLQVTPDFAWNDLVFLNGIYAGLGLAAVALAKLSPLGKLLSREVALYLVGAEFALVALVSNFIHVAVEPNQGSEWRLLATLVAVSVGIWLKNLRVNSLAVAPWLYVSNIAASLVAGSITDEILKASEYPEARSVWFAASLVISTLATKAEIGKLRRVLLLDVPVLVTALWSLIYAIGHVGTNLDVNTWRGILSLAAIAAFAYWRSSSSEVLPWLLTGYLAGLGSSVWLANGLERWLSFDFDGPEFYSVLATASFVIGNYFLVKRVGKKFTEIRLILTIGGFTLPSLVYGFALASDVRSLENETRVFVALCVISALALWRISKTKPKNWTIVAYVSSVSASLAAGRLISDHVLAEFHGPEVYSVLATATIFGVHRVGLKHLTLKSSLFKLGLPLAILLLPSTFYTYNALEIPFSELDSAQLIRIVAILIAAVGLFIHGSRFGNLATSAVGLATLALLVVPNTAMHSEDVVAGSQIDSTSVVIALIVFAIISLIRKYTKLSANSLLYIGVPIGIALAPALTQSLIALGNPTLTSVDWWRFGIILTAGMTLLLVGTLREVAGLFYPGLVSVLLSALPYGFKQTQQNQWSLWVLLLLVAGVMVWLAVRLERLKKAGRNSATWLKELK